MGVPLGAGGVLLLGMYRLEPNWWVQSGAGECKGSRPALPIHHNSGTALKLPCCGVYAIHGVYIYLDGDNWTWGYYHYNWSRVFAQALRMNLTFFIF